MPDWIIHLESCSCVMGRSLVHVGYNMSAEVITISRMSLTRPSLILVNANLFAVYRNTTIHWKINNVMYRDIRLGESFFPPVANQMHPSMQNGKQRRSVGFSFPKWVVAPSASTSHKLVGTAFDIWNPPEGVCWSSSWLLSPHSPSRLQRVPSCHLHSD